MQALLFKQQRAFADSLVGTEMDVLVEKPGREAGQVVGRSPWLQPVVINAELGDIGDIIRVRIGKAGSNSLFAESVDLGQPLKEELV